MRFFLLLTQYKFGAQQIQQLSRIILNDLKTTAFCWPIHRKGAHYKVPARLECGSLEFGPVTRGTRTRVKRAVREMRRLGFEARQNYSQIGS